MSRVESKIFLKNRCVCLHSETYMNKKHRKQQKPEGNKRNREMRKVGVETQMGG